MQSKSCEVSSCHDFQMFLLLSLSNSSCRPVDKENDQMIYINKESNHRPSIVKQLSLPIAPRFLKCSYDGQVGNE